MAILGGWLPGLLSALAEMSVVAINDLLIHFLYMPQYNSAHKLQDRDKDENGELVINGKAIFIFQELVPTNIK